jgi:hypothetical protein
LGLPAAWRHDAYWEVTGFVQAFFYQFKKQIMANQQISNAISEQLILPLALINAIVIRNGYLLNGKWWWMLFITLPLLLWSVAHHFITVKITNHAKDK